MVQADTNYWLTISNTTQFRHTVQLSLNSNRVTEEATTGWPSNVEQIPGRLNIGNALVAERRTRCKATARRSLVDYAEDKFHATDFYVAAVVQDGRSFPSGTVLPNQTDAVRFASARPHQLKQQLRPKPDHIGLTHKIRTQKTASTKLLTHHKI